MGVRRGVQKGKERLATGRAAAPAGFVSPVWVYFCIFSFFLTDFRRLEFHFISHDGLLKSLQSYHIGGDETLLPLFTFIHLPYREGSFLFWKYPLKEHTKCIVFLVLCENSALCVLNYFFLFIPICSFLSVFGSVQCFSKGGCWEDLPLELNISFMCWRKLQNMGLFRCCSVVLA